jgi:hypothetical protein
MEDSQLAFIKEVDALKIERAMLLEKTQPYLNLVNATSIATIHHHHQQQQQQHTVNNHENLSDYPLVPSLPSSHHHHHQDDGDDVGDGNIVNNHEHHYQLSQQRSYVYKRVINPTLLQLKSKIMDWTTNHTSTATDHIAFNLSSTLNLDDKNGSNSRSSSSSTERSRAMDLLNVFEKALSAMDQYYIVSNDEIINSSISKVDDHDAAAAAAVTSNSRGDYGTVIGASVHDNNKNNNNNNNNNIKTGTGSSDNSDGGDIESSPLGHGNNTLLLELVTILAAYVQDEADT